MANSRTHHRRIGEILIEEGVITTEQLQEALSYQRQTGDLVGTILMDMGLVTESDIAKIVSVQYQLPFLSLKNYNNDKGLVERFDSTFLHAHRLLPVDQIGNTLLIVVTEIPTEAVLAEIPARTGLNAALYVGFASEVTRELDVLVPLPEAEKAKLTPARARSPQPGDDEAAEASPKAAADAATAAGDALFPSEGQDFMSELDSTWDSIFEQLDTSGQEDEDEDDSSDDADSDGDSEAASETELLF